MTEQRDSLERIVPEALEAGEATGADTLRLHLERYRFASAHVPSGVVLDLACGVGYGSALLCDGGRRVIGADLSRAALRHARDHYHRPTIEWVRCDGAAWLRPASVDAVVSLETLEHVVDPARLFAAFVAALRPGGVLVGSVPVTPSVDGNPHHLTDFTTRQFLALGARNGLVPFAELKQQQPYSPFAVIARSERRTQDRRRGLPGYYLRHPGAFARRIGALMRSGFVNEYLSVAWRKAP